MNNSTKNEATVTRRKREVDQGGSFNLKKTRQDALKSNYNHVVYKADPPPDSPESEEKSQLSKMEQRFVSTKRLIRSLPEDLNLHLQDWAKTLLHKVITKVHFINRRLYMINNPSFFTKNIPPQDI